MYVLLPGSMPLLYTTTPSALNLWVPASTYALEHEPWGGVVMIPSLVARAEGAPSQQARTLAWYVSVLPSMDTVQRPEDSSRTAPDTGLFSCKSTPALFKITINDKYLNYQHLCTRRPDPNPNPTLTCTPTPYPNKQLDGNSRLLWCIQFHAYSVNKRLLLTTTKHARACLT